MPPCLQTTVGLSSGDSGASRSRKSGKRRFMADDVYAWHFLQVQALIVNILV